MCPYGTNQGARGTIIRFVKGSSDLDSSLNPILIDLFSVAKMDLKQLLDKAKCMEKLDKGEECPAAK